VTQVEIQGQVGPQVLADGVPATFRMEKSGGQVIQQAHGRLYEANYRGALYSGGMALTAINNVTFTSGTLGATCTPVLGVWNPANSPVNLVILQGVLGLTITALQATGAAPFVWATATGQAAISTGAQPLNRKTLTAQGAAGRDVTNVALTGLVGNLVVRGGSALGGGSGEGAAFLATAAGMQTPQYPTVEQLDGAIIVPPGGVLALLATTTPVAHSAASMLLWEEVPV
jgi:hypothetical protein